MEQRKWGKNFRFTRKKVLNPALYLSNYPWTSLFLNGSNIAKTRSLFDKRQIYLRFFWVPSPNQENHNKKFFLGMRASKIKRYFHEWIHCCEVWGWERRFRFKEICFCLKHERFIGTGCVWALTQNVTRQRQERHNKSWVKKLSYARWLKNKIVKICFFPLGLTNHSDK